MGRHGVNDFVRIEVGEDSIFAKYNTSRDIHCETIWSYASRMGRRVTVLNYIGLAPPLPINGHSMPGFVPGRHLRRSSFPPDLFSRLERVEHFDVSLLGLELDIEKQVLAQMPEDAWLPWIDHHIARDQAWFNSLEHLMTHEPSDLTAIVFDGVDKIQHLAYRFLDPQFAPTNPTPWEASVIDRCRTYFVQIDRFLARTLELVGDDARVLIASDHGFTASTELVYINRFLWERGFLVWKDEVDEDCSEAVYVDRLQNHLDLIDIRRTKAFALTPSCNGIFINVPAMDYQRVRQEVIDALYEIQGADGGQVVTDVKLREEWFAGPYMKHAPDLTLTLRDFGLISVLGSAQVVVPRRQPWGTHHPDGVLIARGPGIQSDIEVQPRDIVDVTSLLAYSLDLPIPAEYEGNLPEDFFAAGHLSDVPPRRAEHTDAPAQPISCDAKCAESDGELSEEDEANVLQRLRALGYIE
jgi:predicted AlkP superfamily phosphohydrolase/phosphomutase